MVICNEGLGAKGIQYKIETKPFPHLITNLPNSIAVLWCPQGSGFVSCSNNSSTHSLHFFFHFLCSNSLFKRYLRVLISSGTGTRGKAANLMTTMVVSMVLIPANVGPKASWPYTIWQLLCPHSLALNFSRKCLASSSCHLPPWRWSMKATESLPSCPTGPGSPRQLPPYRSLRRSL